MEGSSNQDSGPWSHVPYCAGQSHPSIEFSVTGRLARLNSWTLLPCTVGLEEEASKCPVYMCAQVPPGQGQVPRQLD